MSIRTKVLNMVDVMMRVPPVMVIDEILRISMGLPTRLYPSSSTDPANTDDGGGVINTSEYTDPLSSIQSIWNANDSMAPVFHKIMNMSEEALAAVTEKSLISGSFDAAIEDMTDNGTLSRMLTITTVKFIFCLLAFVSAACIFMLWTRHLVMVYMFVTSLGMTVLSYWSNSNAVELIEANPGLFVDLVSLNMTRLLDTGGVAMTLLPHFAAQWLMGMLFAYIHMGPRYKFVQKALPIIFVSPICIAILPVPPSILEHLPLIAVIVPLILSKVTIMTSAMDAGKTVYNGYQYAMNFVSNFGLSALIENEWQRLNVPSVLRVFWTIRISQNFVSIAIAQGLSTTNFLPVLQKLFVDGCDTLTAVLGMTAVISMVCHYIGKCVQWFLLAYDSDEEKSLGTVSAVLFYILALQTGLTSLSPEKRFVRLCRNLCLLFTALLHFIHNIVSPILMSLSAAHNPSKERHVRALTVCVLLVMAPITLLYVLWSQHASSTWLLAVTAFSVEVVVKVLVTLSTYTLFLIDARRQSFWEKLDDYLYYVRAFGNSVEFCFGILLFFNGAWILIFESGGAIRAIMMCIHAYFNIWCEAKAGWSVFIKRRTAVHKISALPEATTAQLRAFDDVCAICYQEMYSAKITRCRHYFHGICLRKWLYVQDRCPLCHEIMMYTDRADEQENGANPPPAEEEAPVVFEPTGDNAPPNETEHNTAERLGAIGTAASALPASQL